MTKTKLDKPYPFIHPNPCVIIGTKYQSDINFTTIGDVAVAGLNPALVMISLHEKHLAFEYISKTNLFSINIPTVEMLALVDYCGVKSGRSVDKSKLIKHRIIDGIPIIVESPISLICKVEHKHQIDQRIVLVCSVMDTYLAKECFVDNQLDLSRTKSIVYGLDNKYYTVGDSIGKGYEEYKKV